MKWFYNLKIRVKIILYFVMLVIFIGVVGIIGITNMKNINSRSEDMYKNNLLAIQDAQNIQKDLFVIRSDYLSMLYEKDNSKVQQRINDIQKLIEECNQIQKDYEPTIQSSEERNLFNSLKNNFTMYKNTLDEHMSLMKAGNYSEVSSKVTQLANLREKTDQSIQDLVSLNKKNAETKNAINIASYKSQSIIMIIVIMVGAALAILVGLLFANMISKPLNQIVNAANSIARGDLNVYVKVDTKDEIGILADAFMKMSNNINEAMSNINAAAEEVSAGAKQASDSSIALSQGSTEQASSIEQLTASMEEISSQTSENSNSASKANELAYATKETAVKGNDHMKEMLKSMEDINESSSNISKIIKVIDEIAFQTNILALNAAVEAARAGQHGKGFAVVAEEVRNLAERSANAAKETTNMIEGSIKKVESGTKIASETASALSEIVKDVSQVAELVKGIAEASNEQALGIEQINQGIMQVSNVVQTNSATSEEIAASSEELYGQAEMLKEEVERFKLKKIDNYYSKTEKFSPEILELLKKVNESKNYSKNNSPKIALTDKELELNE